MRKDSNRRFLKGAVAGMIGGLVASWSMNQFQSGVSKVKESWHKSAHAPAHKRLSGDFNDEAATVLLARRLSRAVLGRDLSDDEMKVAEPLVHYSFGAMAGGFYGLLAEFTPAARKGAGTAYATALWMGADEIAIPKLQLSKSPGEYSPQVHAEALATHLVYGVTAEVVRRGVRAML
jgi:hypothetical protein